MRGNIRPIGLQAFPRPGAQDAYSLHIPRGESTKSWIYRFTFTSEDSKYYYKKFKEGEALWIHDKMTGKVTNIHNRSEFMTFNHLTEMIWIRMVGTPEGPIDAEWLNYKNTPCQKKRIQPNEGKYEKVDASMNTEFGTAWLEEKDWVIKE